MKSKGIYKKLLIFTVILLIFGMLHQIIKSVSNRDVSAERENIYITSIQKQFPEFKLKKTNVNGLTVYLWREVWTNNMEHFKACPGFPLFPDINYATNDLRIKIHNQAIGVRIFGYILSYKTDKFQFKIEANDAQTTEVWLSPDQNPNNMTRMERDMTNLNVHNEFSIYETTKIGLTKKKLYYIEIVHATYKVTENITIYWGVNRGYEIIGKEYIFQYPTDIIGNPKKLPSHFISLQTKRTTDPREQIPLIQPLLQEIVSDVFLNCSSQTHQLKPQNVPHFEGTGMVKEIQVFLSNSGIDNPNLLLEGPALDEKEATQIEQSFFQYFQKKSRAITKFELLNLEKIDSEVIGNHYLIEAKVSIHNIPLKKFLLSQMIQTGWGTFCLSTAIPNEIAFIHIVVIVHNQSRWLQHFIDNINKIYEQTNDQLFGVIIVDFNSKDLDTVSVVKRSLKIKFEYIYIESADFNKVMGQHIALQRVIDQNDIIFHCDLHLNLPIVILDTIRKHTLQGYTVFSPMVKRLEGGSVFLDGNGWWDTLGYRLVSMYKTDWLVIGGMNKEYGFKWGGEDLDLVDRLLTVGYHINRLRLPGLIHYHHPRDGKWYRAD